MPSSRNEHYLVLLYFVNLDFCCLIIFDSDIPTATIYPKKIIINATESALLTCNVSGDPHPR